MNLRIKLIYFFLLPAAFYACTGYKNRIAPAKKEIVKTPEEIDDQLPDNLKYLMHTGHILLQKKCGKL